MKNLKELILTALRRKVNEVELSTILKKGKNKIKRICEKKYINLKYGNEIKNYKDKFKGKRCFIIGNGPSLTTDDLEKIKDESSFAANLIYKSFDKTSWRPTFYCVEDYNVLEKNIDEIKKLSPEYEHGFFSGNIYKSLPSDFLKNKKNSFWYVAMFNWESNPSFSFDISDYIAEGMTVTYCNIQLAVYMGFSEIYLLGIDHFYEPHNSYSEFIGKDSTVYNAPRLDKSTLAYRKAAKVCKEKGIKIYNATRGGHLEEFERIDFDSIAQKGE